MADPLRHRQTKGAATDMVDLTPPRHIPTLPCVSRTRRLRAAVRNCTRDEGGPFEAGSQVQVASHRKLLSSRAMVALCQEGARAPCCTRDEGGPFGAVL